MTSFPDDLPPEQVDPVVISESVRRAVLLEVCETEGHVYDTKDLFGLNEAPNPSNPLSRPNLEVQARDTSQLPHVRCERCNLVWIVIDEPGLGYDEALRKMRRRLGPDIATNSLMPRPKQERIREVRKRILAERAHIGQLVPIEVVKETPKGVEVVEVKRVPSYLQPRRK